MEVVLLQNEKKKTKQNVKQNKKNSQRSDTKRSTKTKTKTKKQRGFIVCSLCGKVQEININKPFNEEMKKMDWAELEIKTDEYSEGGFVCTDCLYKHMNKVRGYDVY
jgi:transcription elongation factor Elf1